MHQFACKEVKQGPIFFHFDFIINPFGQKTQNQTKIKLYLQISFCRHKKNELNWISLKAISDKISREVVVVVVILSKELQYIL